MVALVGFPGLSYIGRRGQHRPWGQQGTKETERFQEGEAQGGGARGLPRGSPLTTHRLQEADVLTERSDTAAEGEQEHEDAHHDQQDGWVHSQAGQRRLWGRGCLSV